MILLRGGRTTDELMKDELPDEIADEIIAIFYDVSQWPRGDEPEFNNEFDEEEYREDLGHPKIEWWHHTPRYPSPRLEFGVDQAETLGEIYVDKVACLLQSYVGGPENPDEDEEDDWWWEIFQPWAKDIAMSVAESESGLE